MGSLVRLLLRFIVVPLGMAAATLAASLVVVIGNWQTVTAAASMSDPDIAVFLSTLMPAVMVATLSVAMIVGPLGFIGILIAEAFAIRSAIYHALNGGVAAWLGWSMIDVLKHDVEIRIDLKSMIAAGIAGGFAYWLVAGWSAGFWKPVMRQQPSNLLPPVKPM